MLPSNVQIKLNFKWNVLNRSRTNVTYLLIDIVIKIALRLFIRKG